MSRDEETWLLDYLTERGLVIPRRSKMEELKNSVNLNICRIKDLEMKVQPIEEKLDNFLPLVDAVHKMTIRLLEMFNGNERRLKQIEEILNIADASQQTETKTTSE